MQCRDGTQQRQALYCSAGRGPSRQDACRDYCDWVVWPCGGGSLHLQRLTEAAGAACSYPCVIRSVASGQALWLCRCRQMQDVGDGKCFGDHSGPSCGPRGGFSAWADIIFEAGGREAALRCI